jgi:Ribbon-helix-helix protein, copG family
MVGQDPEFVVSVPTVESEPTLLVPEAESAEPASGVVDEPAADPDDEPIARISLRLPQSVKARVDEKAAAEQISTNAWLIRAVMDALAEPMRPPTPPRPPSPGPIFGPDGPFGPHGVFGPHGPFGIFTDRGERSDRREAQGRVQGWVR